LFGTSALIGIFRGKVLHVVECPKEMAREREREIDREREREKESYYYYGTDFSEFM